MAENPLLPGTDIEVMEKYAPGKRLDFPNFGEVCKTTFAKGTITDFEKISDDPITVKSRVKVTGDFGESDYIPIFYHPKEGYWDDETADPPALATDFDEETGAFKKAWMSFRCGDEVVVMLKEDKPVAVVGFADGVPRVGEDVFQLEYNTLGGTSLIYQWQGSRIPIVGEGSGYPYKGADYPAENMGPDSFSLGLKNEVLPICNNKEERDWSGHFHPGDVEIGEMATLHYEKQYLEWFFSLGPIAFVLQVLVIKWQKTYHVWTWDSIPPGEWGWELDPESGHYVTSGGIDQWLMYPSIIGNKLYSDNLKEEAIALGRSHEGEPLFVDDFIPHFITGEILAGAVSDEWMKNTFLKKFYRSGNVPLGGEPLSPRYLPWLTPYWGYKMDIQWPGWTLLEDFAVRLFFSYFGYVRTTFAPAVLELPDAATLKIFTRPHTKAELEAHGLWPRR
jgi:hypothetical protein